jgi:hypothetical protein
MMAEINDQILKLFLLRHFLNEQYANEGEIILSSHNKQT